MFSFEKKAKPNYCKICIFQFETLEKEILNSVAIHFGSVICTCRNVVTGKVRGGITDTKLGKELILSALLKHFIYNNLQKTHFMLQLSNMFG